VLTRVAGSADFLLSRFRISFPVLKYGTDFSKTATSTPVRGLRPNRAGHCLVENTPKPRSSTRCPFTSACAIPSSKETAIVATIALPQMRIGRRDAVDQLRFDHGLSLKKYATANSNVKTLGYERLPVSVS